MILVACLCAEWCGTCRDYRALFHAAVVPDAATRPMWVDIEDDAELMGDVEVETFPTLVVVSLLPDGPCVRFFGPLLPHAQTLARLLESLRADVPTEQAGMTHEVRALAQRLAARLS